jgi:hypothetical protein
MAWKLELKAVHPLLNLKLMFEKPPLISSESIFHIPSNPIVPAIITVLHNPPGTVPNVLATWDESIVSGITAVFEAFGRTGVGSRFSPQQAAVVFVDIESGIPKLLSYRV